MRHSDWRSRLTAYLTEHAQARFRPGRMDCALFAAGAVAAMTDTDPGRGWRGTYRSLRRGHRLMQAAGHADHIAYFASLFPEVAPAEAHQGDVAVVEEEDMACLGIVQGEMIYVVTLAGFGLVPRERMVRAFRV